MHNINEKLFFLINNIAGQYSFLDSFFIFVTNIFIPVIIILSLFWFFVFIPKKNILIKNKISSYKNGLMLIFTLFTVFIVVTLIKNFFAFPRPEQILNNINVLASFGGYDSFPSMHSALSFSLAAFMFNHSKMVGWTLFVFASLVGISRIFVGVHFPIDVFVGAILGIIITYVINFIFNHYNI